MLCVQICIQSICGTVTIILYCNKSHFHEHREDKYMFRVNCIVFDGIFDCRTECFDSICVTMMVSAPNVFPEYLCSYVRSNFLHDSGCYISSGEIHFSSM